jgi:MFS family permease
MNWIVSAFTLTSATFILFWAQMSDIFGRHVAIQVVLVLMMIGSAICTSAPVDAFPALIFGRAIQGLAAAGINVIVRTIMADKVSLREYSVNFSIFSFVSGLAVSVAPVIGGYLTNKNWRWCFGINLPVAASGIILIFLVLRKELLGPQPLPEPLARDSETENDQRTARFKARLSTIDFGGQLLFLFGMGLFILALTWGGGNYKWDDAHVLVPLVLGGILIICFLWWQYMMIPGQFLSRKLPTQRSMVPWRLVSQRNIGLLFYVNIATGMGICYVTLFKRNLTNNLSSPYRSALFCRLIFRSCEIRKTRSSRPTTYILYARSRW